MDDPQRSLKLAKLSILRDKIRTSMFWQDLGKGRRPFLRPRDSVILRKTSHRMAGTDSDDLFLMATMILNPESVTSKNQFNREL